MRAKTAALRKASESGVLDATLRDFLGYRLKRAYNIIRAEVLNRLEPFGLRLTTFSALVLIVDNPGLRQSELSQALDIKRSNMVAIVDDLEGWGWINRRSFPADRRAVALYATKAGQKIYQKAVAVISDHEASVAGTLSKKELAQLLSILEKIESSTDTQ